METNIFKVRDIEHGTAKLFFDESGTVDIQRYESSKYPIFQKLLDKQQSFFWLPQEINMSKDAIDFKGFSEAQEHIFTSNLKRQILLDSVQGRAPCITFGQVVSDPALESLITWWQASEVIHSQSYTHIIRNVYPNPSKVFDEMKDIREIVELGDSVSVFYDDLLGKIRKLPYGNFETKRALYRCLLSVNALEQIRFHVSFACTYSFAQQGLMTGSAKIIQLIHNDELLHCGITTNLLKLLPKDDPDFERIAEQEKQTAYDIYMDVHKQEKEWVKYLFSRGTMFGITQQELEQYLDWLVGGCMRRMGLDFPISIPKRQPLPWMRRYTDSRAEQVAPQESEITSYESGNVSLDIDNTEIDFDF